MVILCHSRPLIAALFAAFAHVLKESVLGSLLDCCDWGARGERQIGQTDLTNVVAFCCSMFTVNLWKDVAPFWIHRFSILLWENPTTSSLWIIKHRDP